MPRVGDYSKCKIYKITSLNNPELVYYGHTCQTLSQRFASHKTLSNKTTSKQIFEKGDAVILLIEDFPCESDDQAKAREAFYILNNPCVNKIIPGRTDKEYYEAHKEHIREKHKEYYETNKEKSTEYHKEYREMHKEQIREQSKEYYELNKEEIKEYREKNKDMKKEYDKQYREKHKDIKKESDKQYRETHKEQIKEYMQQYRLKKKQQKLLQNNF